MYAAICMLEYYFSDSYEVWVFSSTVGGPFQVISGLLEVLYYPKKKIQKYESHNILFNYFL